MISEDRVPELSGRIAETDPAVSSELGLAALGSLTDLKKAG
jgi:hypothetical protein